MSTELSGMAGRCDREPEAQLARLELETTALRQELARRSEEQAATGAILRAIASRPADLGGVLNAVAQGAIRLCETNDAVIFQVVEGGARPISSAGPMGLAIPPDHIMPIDRLGIPGRAMADRATVHVPDVMATLDEEFPGGATMARLHGIRSALAAPLVHQATAIGAIYIRRTELRPFTDEQIALLETFADQAVIAIENARLFRTLHDRTEELGELNRTLEARVADQVEQLERVGRLRRYLSPQLADLIVSSGDESILESHRRRISVVFCDLRGFTAFAETAEPEEVTAVLGEYHRAMGELIGRFDATLDWFAGDGLMVFFNDPLPQPDYAERAVRMACAMRERATDLAHGWRRAGYELDFGVGIAVGYATLGRIGFEGRYDYTAIGTVTNLAARLCGEAAGGQILIPARLHGMIERLVEAEPVGDLTLKGLHRPVTAFNITGLRDDTSGDEGSA